MKKIVFFVVLLLSSVFIITCNKKDSFPTVELREVMSMRPGKYVIYRLDSLTYTNFNSTLTTTRYQAKDVVDAAITDNLGRPGWRVIRYLRDSASTNEADWKNNITYSIIIQSNSVEVIEENQRYIKLVQPIRDNFSWRGNAYINPDVFDASFSINIWDYTYDNVYAPFTLSNNLTIDSAITVNQRDEVLGDIHNPLSYSVQNYSQEVYAPGIGLVYKYLFHSEYQPGDGSLTNPSYFGYGIRLRMISHN